MQNWATPISLAATLGISVDFYSSGYLDVSVLQVRFDSLFYSAANNLQAGWVLPFGHPRIKACLLLPVAYRSNPRPS